MPEKWFNEPGIFVLSAFRTFDIDTNNNQDKKWIEWFFVLTEHFWLTWGGAQILFFK